MNIVPALIAALVLALVHIIIGKLRFLSGTPRSRWLSIAGGVSVAYVFMHLLPELSAGQEVVAREVEGLAFLENHVYLMALLGLAVFYGLERAAKSSRSQQQARGEGDSMSAGVFWLHIASFGVYNALIGYLLLHRERPGLTSLIFFAIAMALHFVVTDYGLRDDREHSYDQFGRWVLVLAVLLGWGIGLMTEISEFALAILVAFLAGGVILNVLKEELPEERRSRFSAFAIGAGIYAALLLTL